MFKSNRIIVGLEVGTSKVCAMVGDLNPEGVLTIIGVGQARSRGVRKGEIVDATKASEDIRNAIVEAEQMADVEIRRVYLGVSGAHIRSLNNRGFHPIVGSSQEISAEDVQDAIKNARACAMGSEMEKIHVIRQHFLVDGQDGIADPVGMVGAKVEVDVHVVHGNYNRLQNPVRVVKGLQLEVEEIVFNGLASTLAVLTPEQKELGALVIDMGGGTTEFVVSADGVIKHTGVLSVGGDHVSNDLAYGLRVPLGRAEELKIQHGTAVITDAPAAPVASIPGEVGLPERTVSLHNLRRIMVVRLEETLELIAQELARLGLLNYLRAGVFLTGGCARIPEIHQMAQRVFGMPAVVGRSSLVNGVVSALDQPEFAAAIGLVRFGSFQQRRPPERGGWGGLLRGLTEVFRGH